MNRGPRRLWARVFWGPDAGDAAFPASKLHKGSLSKKGGARKKISRGIAPPALSAGPLCLPARANPCLPTSSLFALLGLFWLAAGRAQRRGKGSQARGRCAIPPLRSCLPRRTLSKLRRRCIPRACRFARRPVKVKLQTRSSLCSAPTQGHFARVV